MGSIAMTSQDSISFNAASLLRVVMMMNPLWLWGRYFRSGLEALD
jgi:hypothetical protein